jgi:hypothetical protein
MLDLVLDMESIEDYELEDTTILYYDVYDKKNQIRTKEGYPFSLEIDFREKNMAFINPEAFTGDEEELFDIVVALLETKREFFEYELNAPLSTLTVNYVDNKIWRYDGAYSHKLNLNFFNYMSKVYL